RPELDVPDAARPQHRDLLARVGRNLVGEGGENEHADLGAGWLGVQISRTPPNGERLRAGPRAGTRGAVPHQPPRGVPMYVSRLLCSLGGFAAFLLAVGCRPQAPQAADAPPSDPDSGVPHTPADYGHPPLVMTPEEVTPS